MNSFRFRFRLIGFVIAVLWLTGATGAANKSQKQGEQRLENLEIQRAVRSIKPADVKEICFLIAGEFPGLVGPLPPHTGPVTSRSEIASILRAFSNSTRDESRYDDLPTYNEPEEVWIGLKNGQTLQLQVDGYPNDYEPSLGRACAEVMRRHHGSCSYDRAVADGLDKKAYGLRSLAPTTLMLMDLVRGADGRYENSAIQNSVKAIASTDVKEICFIWHGSTPSALPRNAGPITSTKQIQSILYAFARSSRSPKIADESTLFVDHDELWIALKNGETLLLELSGYPKEYGLYYGEEVARIMKDHAASCPPQRIAADRLDRHVYRPYDVALSAPAVRAFQRRFDGRLDNLEIQAIAKSVSPSAVKEICFTLVGTFPKPLPRITGPVTSPPEIKKILDAFAKSSSLYCLRNGGGIATNHEQVWIGLKDGRTILMDLNGYPNDYGDFYGPEVAGIMKQFHGSCSYERVVADGLNEKVSFTPVQ